MRAKYYHRRERYSMWKVEARIAKGFGWSRHQGDCVELGSERTGDTIVWTGQVHRYHLNMFRTQRQRLGVHRELKPRGVILTHCSHPDKFCQRRSTSSEGTSQIGDPPPSQSLDLSRASVDPGTCFAYYS
jgi:hypothetical protein